MLNRKTLSVVVLLSCAFSASAVTNPEVKFRLKANIPSQSFYVQPVGNWNDGDVKMLWNEAALSLNAISHPLAMKNSAGGISAYLLEDAQLSNVDGTPIPLSVTVNNVLLTAGSSASETILPEAEAATTRQVNMVVTQTTKFSDADRPPAGDYYGDVTMIFDSVLPPDTGKGS